MSALCMFYNIRVFKRASIQKCFNYYATGYKSMVLTDAAQVSILPVVNRAWTKAYYSTYVHEHTKCTDRDLYNIQRQRSSRRKLELPYHDLGCLWCTGGVMSCRAMFLVPFDGDNSC